MEKTQKNLIIIYNTYYPSIPLFKEIHKKHSQIIKEEKEISSINENDITILIYLKKKVF